MIVRFDEAVIRSAKKAASDVAVSDSVSVSVSDMIREETSVRLGKTSDGGFDWDSNVEVISYCCPV